MDNEVINQAIHNIIFIINQTIAKNSRFCDFTRGEITKTGIISKKDLPALEDSIRREVDNLSDSEKETLVYRLENIRRFTLNYYYFYACLVITETMCDEVTRQRA